MSTNETKNAEKPAKKEPGACAQIREMFAAGKTNEEIIKKGFNKGTIYVQRGKWNKEKGIKKEKKAPAVKKSAEKKGTNPKDGNKPVGGEVKQAQKKTSAKAKPKEGSGFSRTQGKVK